MFCIAVVFERSSKCGLRESCHWSQANRENVVMMKINLFNRKDCLVFWVLKLDFGELKCPFYEMLVTNCGLLLQVTMISLLWKIQQQNNSNAVLLPAPVFRDLFYSFMKFTTFVMTTVDNLMYLLLINNDTLPSAIWPWVTLNILFFTLFNLLSTFYCFIPSIWLWIIMLVGICWLCSANLKTDCLKIWLDSTWRRWW